MFEIQLIICIKMDLASNNLQRLICHKNQTINQPKCTTVAAVVVRLTTVVVGGGGGAALAD